MTVLRLAPNPELARQTTLSRSMVPVDDLDYLADDELDSGNAREKSRMYDKTGNTGNPSDEVVIAVMGSTGTGKSSFVRLLSGDKSVHIGDSLESETSEIQVVRFVDYISGRKVTIVDTPGFDDSRHGITDTDILKKITNFLLEVYDEKRKVNGLVYLQRISDPRFGGHSSRNLRMFQNLCGTESFKNVIVLTTFWDKVTPGEGAKREQQLKESFFKELFSGGACFMRHSTNTRSAQDVLKQVLNSVPTDVQIQMEIRVKGKSLEDTAAGSVHSKEVEAIIAKHREEMNQLTAEIIETRKTNKELALKLQKERTELKEKLAKWEAEKSELKKGLEEEKQARKQLRADPRVERERHEKWHGDKKRESSGQLDAQTKIHSPALENVQEQLRQESVEAHKGTLRAEEMIRLVEEKTEKDRKRLEELRNEEERQFAQRIQAQQEEHAKLLGKIETQAKQQRLSREQGRREEKRMVWMLEKAEREKQALENERREQDRKWAKSSV